MKIGLGAALLDDQPCGMRVALDEFLGAAQLRGLAEGLILIHRKRFRDETYAAFGDVVIPPKSFRGAGYYWSQVQIPRAIRGSEIDLLHWPCQIMPPVHVEVPLVISVWDLAPLSFAEPGWTWVRTRVKYGWILSGALRVAARIIAHSQAIADELTRRFEIDAGKITVVYPGLSTRFVREAHCERRIDPESPLLYIGTNTPRKNLPLLIQAYALLARKKLRNKLLLRVNFTESESTAFLKEFERIGVPPGQIEIVPPLDTEGLVELYRRCALFVFPSLYEGFGLPMIEAMACGLPVVALNRSAMPEVLGDTGTLVENPQPEDFAQAISNTLRQLRQDGDALAEQSQARALKFRWSSALEETLGVYEQACGAAVIARPQIDVPILNHANG